MKYVGVMGIHWAGDKRFAWRPIKLDSNKYVWLTHYYVVVTFTGLTNYYEILDCEKLSVDEYIVRKLSR